MKLYIKASNDYDSIFSYDVDSRANVARTTCDVSLLEVLAYDPAVEVRESVASNVNTPADIIIDYLANFSEHYSVRKAATDTLISHKDDDIFIKQLFSESSDRDAKYNVALCTYNSEILAILSEDPYVDVRRLVAGNTDTSHDILFKLTSDPDLLVRNALADRDDATSELLAILSNDEDAFVRGQVAENLNTPADLLGKLAGDDNWTVRESVAKNINAPAAVLNMLCNDRIDFVAENAKKTLASGGINT